MTTHRAYIIIITLRAAAQASYEAKSLKKREKVKCAKGVLGWHEYKANIELQHDAAALLIPRPVGEKQVYEQRWINQTLNGIPVYNNLNDSHSPDAVP
jgi:hypothetical protein